MTTPPGTITTDFGSSYGQSVTLQPDGKIIVAGSSNGDFALACYNPNGSLDTTFSGDGKLITPIGSDGDYGYSVTLQPDGKILVTGYSYNRSRPYFLDQDFALVRYLPDGSLDTTFSGDGKLTTDFASSLDNGYSVTLQADGKILVAGNVRYDYRSSPDFALVRYLPDGSLDTSFSGNGIEFSESYNYDYDEGYSVTVQPDGKIIVAGSSNGDFALVRYLPDGSLDATFSGDGKLITDFESDGDYGYSLTLQPDGKIIVAGYSSSGSYGGYADFALARYLSDGSLDTSFSDDGKLTTDFGSSYDIGQSVTLQADGKILVAGYSKNGSNWDSPSDFALARYNPDGSLDTTFEGNGKLTTDFGSDRDYGYSVTLQRDGKIIVAGSSYNGSNGNFALARYLPDGTLDPTFNGIAGPAAPTLANTNLTLAENSAAGTPVATVIGSDANGDALTYQMSGGNLDIDGDGQAAFAINRTTGAITVNDAGDLNYEKQAAFALIVTATDSGGLTGNGTITVNLSDVVEKNPGVTITPLQTPSITSEGNALVTGIAGGVATFSIVLNTAPLDDNVTLTFTSNNPAEGKPVNPVLTFTPSNWNVAQILTIQGQDDLLDDGDVSYIVAGTVSSDDIDYIRGIEVPNQYLKNLGYAEDIVDPILGYVPNGTRDYLIGSNGNDRIYGGYDNDFLYGENGNDKLYGEQDNDILYGNDGNDTLDGGLGADTMIGGNGADIYYVDNERDVIDDQGTDKAVDKVIVPVSISYTLGASIENATLIGADNSRLTGNMLANILTGNSGNNLLNGAAGNDTLAGGAGNDTLQGGTGIDTANYATATTAVNVNLATGKATGEGTDIIRTIENILSGKGSDILTGNSSANNLNGGAGNDIISGGAGRDILIGSAGADKFVYQKLTDSGIGSTARDVIQDFSTAQGDKIDLHLIGAKNFIAGNFSGSAGQVRFDSVNHLLQFDLNADKTADGEIELIGVTALNATDLILLN